MTFLLFCVPVSFHIHLISVSFILIVLITQSPKLSSSVLNNWASIPSREQIFLLVITFRDPPRQPVHFIGIKQIENKSDC
jgi:hypothetical protein